MRERAGLPVWRRPRRLARRAGRGMVLLAVMVVLALMLLAGAGAMRAVDTGNVIAGNFSFQQSAMQASDRPMSDALSALSSLVVAGGGNTALPNRYFNVQQSALDARGFPSAIDWSSVSCTDPNGVVLTNCAQDNGQYRIQYVLERRCSANPNLANPADIRALCEYEASSTALSAGSIAVRYRVLIRVRGPRNTEGWFEAMVSGPASI
jgi:hypothetical protein